MKCKKGFTLVELLTVIFIITLLFSIITSVIVGAISSARKVECASNLHDLYISMKMFQIDHDDKLPKGCINWYVAPDPSTLQDPENRTFYRGLRTQLKPYGMLVKSWVCPLDPQGPEYRWFPNWKYNHNCKVNICHGPDLDNDPIGDTAEHLSDRIMFCEKGIMYWQHRFHGKAFNALFADGHVKYIFNIRKSIPAGG